MIQNTLGRRINGVAHHAGLFVAFGIRQERQAFAQRTELTQRIPTQVVFFDQLLNMLVEVSRGTSMVSCIEQVAQQSRVALKLIEGGSCMVSGIHMMSTSNGTFDMYEHSA